jgi:hypothetical protein
MLGGMENVMIIPAGVNTINNEADPALAKNFNKHNRTLSRRRRIISCLRYGTQPAPPPPVRYYAEIPERDKVIIDMVFK